MSYTLPSPPSFACAPEATTSALIELISALIRAITAFCIRDLSHVSQPPRRPFTCSYCSDPAHFIRCCPRVSDDIRAGLCQRNARGKIVLPSGLFVPHSVPGLNIRSRIAAYTCQLAATASSASSASPIVAVSAPTPSPPSSSPPPLCHDTEIAALEREINALRSELGINSLDPDEIRIAEIERELASLRTASPSIASPTAPQLPSNSPSSTPSASLYPPHHLSRPMYRLPLASNRPEDIPGYAPPRMRNFGLPPPPPPPPRRKIPAPSLDTPFRSTPTPPPEDSMLAFASNPDVPFAITMRDLLSLAPDAHTQILAAATNTPGIAYPVPLIPHLPIDAPTPHVLPPATFLDKYYADFKRNSGSQLSRFSHRD